VSDNVRKPLEVIGKHRRRVDGRAKVTGATRFADDLALPRMLHCRLLRSHLPHARILSIDTSKAEAVPGVKLVLTGAHFPISYGILPVSEDENPLTPEHLRFVGDPYAAVVADSEETCMVALDLIEAELEPLTTISSPEDALATPEPQLHDYAQEGNVHKKVGFDFGDVDEAIAGAAHVFDDTFFYEGNTHLPIEQHAALAELDRDGKLVLYSSTQTPHYVHRALAQALAMNPAHIRVIATPNGGGFGGKTDPFNHEIVVAKAALMLGRPVKICLNREEVFYCHRGRHPVLMKLRTGVDADGNILGQELQTVLDGGGYGSYGVASTFYTGALQTVTYHIPRYRFRGLRAFTNKPPCGPKRGHGTPQPRFGLEVQLDKIAVELGKNPADLRLQQLAEPNTVTANWLRLGSIGLRECIEKVVEGSGYRERWNNLPEGRGLGLACSSYLCGAGLPIYWNDMPHSGVQLQLDRSGLVTVFCGSTDCGQGSDDVLAACVAEVLGIDPFDLRVVTGDTDLTPVDLGSYSSRVTLMTGNAAIQAAERVREPIVAAVAESLKVPKNRIVMSGGRVFDAEDPDKGMPFRDAVIAAEAVFGTIGSVGSYKPPRAPGKFKGAGVGPSPTYSYSAAVVEVQVDPDTGWWDPIKIWIGHDIGTCINRTLVINQVEGGVYMGLGEVQMEESMFRRLPPKLSGSLVHKFPSVLEYKTPSTMDMPPVVTYLVEDPDASGPFGAKEVGQGPLLPIMPAVANAIYDAVGVRVDQVPIQPEQIVKAMAARDKRFGPTAFPHYDVPRALIVPPPWEGGDGKATNTPPRRPDPDFQPPHPHEKRLKSEASS
jgi:4-hydroxybenzoyl-CoA reductase alpha subunit